MQVRDDSKIGKMREAADICSLIFEKLVAAVSIGVTTLEIDAYAEQLCRDHGVIPAFKGYDGFSGAICANLNDIVVHGIPSDQKLEEGDLFGLDFGVKYKNVYSDMSITIPIGEVDLDARKLMNVAKEATLAGIAQAKPGNTVGDIGAAMQGVVERAGFSVVREMVGHGIGFELHEDPYVPGYGVKGAGETLYDGQTLAVESIINEGSPAIFIDSDDGWTTYTDDGMLSALFEHTIVVGSKPEILTRW